MTIRDQVRGLFQSLAAELSPASPQDLWNAGYLQAVAERIFPSYKLQDTTKLSNPHFKAGYDWALDMPLHARFPVPSYSEALQQAQRRKGNSNGTK